MVDDNRAGPLSLAATWGISVDFFSSGYLDVSVHRVRFANLCIQLTMTQKGRVSPFGNPRVKASLSARRGLSQTTTSFIASYRLGIHRVRFCAWSYNPKKPDLLVFCLVCFVDLVVHSVTYSSTFLHSLRWPPHSPTKILRISLIVGFVRNLLSVFWSYI